MKRDARTKLQEAYAALRLDCHELEKLLQRQEEAQALSEKELKRLDKALTVMKAGFKMLKKVAKATKPQRMRDR